MRISDWSSDVCSSDLAEIHRPIHFIHDEERVIYCAREAYVTFTSGRIGEPQKTLSDSTGYRRFQAGDFVVRFDVKARYRRARADAKVAALCDARTFNRLRIDRKSTRLNSSH